MCRHGFGAIVIGAARHPERPAPAPVEPVATTLRRRPRPAVLILALAAWGAALILLGRGAVLAGSLAWLLSLAALPWAFAVGGGLPRSELGRIAWREVVAVVLLLAVGAAFRFYALREFPTGMHEDEGGWGLVSTAILRGAGPYPFGVAVVTAPPDLAYEFNSDPAMPAYVTAVGVALLGRTIEGIRLVPAIVGGLSLPALYWVARRMFGVRTALVALALLATNHVDVYFSRLGRAGGPPVLLLTTLAFGCLWLGLTRDRPVWYVLAGIFGGLDLYAHFGARPVPLIFGAVFALTPVSRPDFRRACWRPMALSVLGALIAIGPGLQFFIGRPELVLGQESDRFVLNDPGDDVEMDGPRGMATLLRRQAAAYLETFVRPLPASEFHPGSGEPLFATPVAPLVVLGIALAVLRWRDARYRFVLLWLIGFLIAGVLSSDAPQLHRVVAVLPAAALLGGAAASELIGRLTLDLPAKARLAARPALAGLLLFGAVEDGRAFFDPDAPDPWQAESMAARYAADQDADTTVVVAGAPRLSATDSRLRYLAAGPSLRDLLNPSIQLAELEGASGPLTFVLDRGVREWLPVIQAYFPDGTEERMQNDDGSLVLVGYQVAPSVGPRATNVDPSQGLELRLGDGSPAAAPLQVAPFVAYRAAAALGEGRPFSASWRGQLIPDQPGPYEVELVTSGETQLLIGGRPVLDLAGGRVLSGRVEVALAPRQSIELRYRHRGGRGTLELYWRGPGGARALLPPGRIEPPAPDDPA